MPQHRVECECGFEEQSVDTQRFNEAMEVVHEHQEDCTEVVTVWEAVHASSLSE